MIHTANLLVSGGMGTPGLPPNLQGSGESGNAAGRSTTRKSQIIEEEDIADEEIEEVEAFSSPEGREVSFDEARAAPDSELGGKINRRDDASEGVEPVGGLDPRDCRPTLAPALNLDVRVTHPPRSSSLNDEEVLARSSSNPAHEKDGVIGSSSAA
jgi:hypothetical protein